MVLNIYLYTASCPQTFSLTFCQLSFLNNDKVKKDLSDSLLFLDL